jgi:hypothetical protein
MNKILGWFERNRNPIGYTIGGLNLASGLTNILTGNMHTGLLNLSVGVYITVDTWAFRSR